MAELKTLNTIRLNAKRAYVEALNVLDAPEVYELLCEYEEATRKYKQSK